ncbi:MAG: branched-chain amino acid ABC transporter permease [Clostridium sp.]|jgi:branched-chain amino acid transport system permease protein|nr:branched-chain amino acid ABC transporter permease [Clostridium sp.]
MNYLPYMLAGVSVGGQYALIAIGYTMVYGILRLINFAHGDIFMAAGLILIYLANPLTLWLALPLVLIVTAVIGFLVERMAYKPLRDAPRMSVMISAIGISYLIQNITLYITGGLAKTYPAIPWVSDTITLFGATTKRVTVITPVLTLALIAGLILLVRKTKIGMAMRAVSRDFDTSRLMGVKINTVISVTFIIGSFLAAVGSMLYFANYTAIVPTSGAMPGLKAFVAAVFGGIGSIPGAVIGAFLIGICENMIKSGGSSWTTFSDAFTFVLLIIILVVKPTGLFGEKQIDKV